MKKYSIAKLIYYLIYMQGRILYESILPLINASKPKSIITAILLL